MEPTRSAPVLPPWEAALPTQRLGPPAPHIGSPTLDLAPARWDSPEDRTGTAPAGPAAALAALAVGLSFLVIGTTYLISTGGDRTTVHAIDLGEVWIGVLYAVVAGLAVAFVRHYRVRLRWSRGPAAASALIGLVAGGVSGLTVVLHSQSVSGHAVVDPTIGLQLSEASTARVLFGLLVPVIVAPLVEETVFRGLLAESLLGRGLLIAAGASAPAFWLWHWRLSGEAFAYFTAFGIITAIVYRHRGLAGSMVAHATFNGILVAVVVSQLAAPARSVEAGSGLTVTVPASWSQVSAADGLTLLLRGPSGAEFGTVAQSVPRPLGAAELVATVRARAAGIGAGQIAPGGVGELTLPAGDAVEITVIEGAHRIQVVELPVGTRVYEIVIDNEGSATAQHESQQMLQSLRVS